jgi:CRISPR-associated protein Cmr2
MTDAILIFTFSPIQSFISEARRAGDLYAGSKILSRLANAAATVLQGAECTLIYPANPNPNDTPNKLVALVPFEQAKTIAADAEKALLKEWQDIAGTAQKKLGEYQPAPDETWRTIWERQRDAYWEIYWVAQRLNGNYKAAFKAASDALDAVKRTRAFVASEEEGMKDSLSGKRSALRVANGDAKAYWARVGENIRKPSLLRSEGKERLDTLGAVKRFCKLKDEDEKRDKTKFLSVSSVATADFLEVALDNAKPQLEAYRDAVKSWAYQVRDNNDWPFDGDLFFVETLMKKRVEDSYGVTVSEADLQTARRALGDLIDRIAMKPSPYYAILQLDGDSMGNVISECDDKAHGEFSRALAEFAKQVERIVKQHYGELIYNGGDDVLALAPLSQALPLAQELANAFQANVKQPADKEKSCTMSAGIAIAHHLYPLDAALGAARNAERRAKEVDGKNAVCVRVLKRSGETFDARSAWDAMGETFEQIVNLFDDKGTGASALSSRFAYDVARSAYALPDADARWQSELKRLLKRHRNSKDPNAPAVDIWAEKLKTWAEKLPDHADELGRWLVLARFVAQGGGE